MSKTTSKKVLKITNKTKGRLISHKPFRYFLYLSLSTYSSLIYLIKAEFSEKNISISIKTMYVLVCMLRNIHIHITLYTELLVWYVIGM